MGTFARRTAALIAICIGGCAIWVAQAPAATFFVNSIFSNGNANGGLGIALVNSGNDSLSAPHIVSVVTAGGSTTVTFTLATPTPNTAYALEFFANAACDPSGNGEGQKFVVEQTNITDNSGDIADHVTITPAIPAAMKFVTATATNNAAGPLSLDTSQFSNCTSH